MSNASLVSEVKRMLLASRQRGDETTLHSAYNALKTAKAAASVELRATAVPTELFILCCEEAISQSAWSIAEETVNAFSGQPTTSQALHARALYCEGAVQCHALPSNLRGDEMVEGRQTCAALVLKGLVLAVEEWPKEAWTVVEGVRVLWNIIYPLYCSGYYSSVTDMITFATTLHERLMIGGAYTHIEWATRQAVCLRSAGRLQEALAQLTKCTEIAQRLGNDRLQVQLLRIAALVVAERDAAAAVGGKAGKPETQSVRPAVVQAIITTQLFMSGSTSGPTLSATAELVAVHDRLLTGSGNSEREGVSGSRTRTKGGAAKTAGMDNTITDPEVMEEVLSDVCLSLALCDEEERCPATTTRLLASTNLRSKTFAMYAKTVTEAHKAHLFDFLGVADASSLTTAVTKQLLSSIREVESAMDSARMIEDVSERQYALHVGCVLLWNFGLPLMQESTHAKLKHTLSRITRELETGSASSASHIRFQVRAEFESSLAEFKDDNLSTVSARVHKALTRGYTATYSDGNIYFPMDFPLLWLLHRTEIYRRPSASAEESAAPPSSEDHALASVEQARSCTNPSRRVLLLKAAFNKLPSLSGAAPSSGGPSGAAFSGTTATSGEGVAAEAQGRHDSTAAAVVDGGSGAKRHVSSHPAGGGGQAERRKSRCISPTLEAPVPPRQSLVVLYFDLLKQCQQSMAPSLLPIATSLAEALCDMVVPFDDKHTDLLRIQADAQLSMAAALLATNDVDQVGGEASIAAQKAKRGPSTDEAGASGGVPAEADGAARITRALLQCGELAEKLDALGYPNPYITINACQMFLDWRGPCFARACFAEYITELSAFYGYFSRLRLDFDREARLTVDIALLYILALMQQYIKQKGEVNDELGTKEYSEFVSKVCLYPKGENGNALLRQAHEVCTEVISRVFSPAAKMQVLLLYPAICRLVGVKMETGPAHQPHHAQMQLLVLLGRMAGPIMSREEKRQTLRKEAVELLRTDPAVQLCGLVAAAAEELGEDRVALAACELADELYTAGRLGWECNITGSTSNLLLRGGVSAGFGSFSTSGSLAASPNSGTYGTAVATGSAASSSRGASPLTAGSSAQRFWSTGGGSGTVASPGGIMAGGADDRTASGQDTPAVAHPTQLDWLWYSRTLLCQAYLYHRRGRGLAGESGTRLGLRTLILCTNCAIAATHAPQDAQHPLLVRAMTLHLTVASVLWASGVAPQLLSPSLKMLLSQHVVSHLQDSVTPGKPATGLKSPSADTSVVETLSALGQLLLRCCADEGAAQDGMQALTDLMAVLPARFHRDFKVLEMQFRCALNLPTEALLRTMSCDDADAVALAWMTLARYTGDPEKSSAAWKQALVAVKSQPGLRAAVLLGMVQHLCERGAVSCTDARVLLLSALDLVEGTGDASGRHPNAAAAATLNTLGRQQLADRRALLFPSRLVGTLTGRTLLLTRQPSEFADPKSAAALIKGSSATTFSELMLAVRVTYLLFCVAAMDCHADTNAEVAGSPRKQEKEVPITQRDCSLLLVHYIDCLWRLAAAHISQQDGARPLEPPTELAGWFGFFASPTHGAALRAVATAADSRHNSEAIQGIYFHLAEFLFEEGLEHYVLPVLAWAHVAACWRYGGAAGDDAEVDCRVLAMQRAAFLFMQRAAAKCGAGVAVTRAYTVLPASPTQCAALKAALEHVRSPHGGGQAGAEGTQRVKFIFSTYMGGLHDVLLREARALEEAGGVQAAAGIADMVLPTAMRIGDWDAVAACHLHKAGLLLVHDQAQRALDWMHRAAASLTGDGEDPSVAGSDASTLMRRVSPGMWIRWKTVLLRVLVQLVMDSTREGAPTISVADAAARLTEIRSVCEDGVAYFALTPALSFSSSARMTASSAAEDALTVMQTRLADFFDRSVVSTLSPALETLDSHRNKKDEEGNTYGLLSGLLDAVLSRMSASPRWNSRALALHVRSKRFTLASSLCILQQAALQPAASVEELSATLSDLHAECKLLDGLVAEVEAEVRCFAAVCTATTGVHARPSCYQALSSLLTLKGQNMMARLKLVEQARRMYRALDMHELNIPSGPGPKELEKHVLRFMRDPAGTDNCGGDEEPESASVNMAVEWRRPVAELPEETRNALEHFGISVAAVQGINRFQVLSCLRSALDAAGGSHSHGLTAGITNIAAAESLYAVALGEVQWALESAAAGSAGRLPVDTATEAIAAVLDERWAEAPLAAVERSGVGRKSVHGDRLRTRATTTAAQGGAAGLGNSLEATDIDARTLTEREAWLLDALHAVAQDAQRRFHYTRAYECYILLSHMCVLWERPHAAGSCVEFALAAKTFAVLTATCFATMEDTPEGQVWRRVQLLHDRAPELLYSCVYADLRVELLTVSPMLERFEVAGEWPRLADALCVQESPCLSLVMHTGGYLHVALRHPDGNVDARRYAVNLKALEQLVKDTEAFAAIKAQSQLAQQTGIGITSLQPTSRSQLSATAVTVAVRDASRTAMEELSPLLSRMEADLLTPCVGELSDALEWLCTKTPLVLCLDPALQSLPLEFTDFFSGRCGVQREISVPSLLHRGSGTRGVTGKTAAATLCVVDPFGEHAASVETLTSSEGKSKGGQTHFLTALNGTIPFSTEYLLFELEAPTHSTALFTGCGRLSSVLPPRALTSATLDHLQAVVIAMDGVTEAAARREQKNSLTVSSESALEWRWLTPLLFLARGARSVAVTCLPAAPFANDAFCKRVLPSLISGRGLSDVSVTANGKGKEGRKELVLVYGASSSSAAKVK